MIDTKLLPAKGSDLLIYDLPSSSGKKNSAPIATLNLKRKNVFNFRNLSLFQAEADFQRPEYNLYEIGAAEDADGYVRRAIKIKRALADKEGWELQSKNNRTKEYLQRRIKQIELSSGYPFKLMIKDTLGDLVRYNNAFWHIVRADKNSGGSKRLAKKYGRNKNLQPIAGIFRIAPETMRIRTDKYGNPIQYKQEMPDGRYKVFNVENIIHYTFNKRAGFNFAAPSMMPGIDDIRALRRLEENVELLVEGFLFPLMVAYVGTDQWPATDLPDGTSEVDVWASKMEALPSTGGMAVPHRVKFDTIGFDKTLDVSKYLDHFKKRAFSALGVSNLDMGEGDGMNRSTADSASKLMIDDVKDYQKEFKYQIDFELFTELLLEKYDVSVLDEDNFVSMAFKEIDLESLMKYENHVSLMYGSHLFTEDEARMAIKKDVVDQEEERSGMYIHRVEEEKMKLEAKYAPAPAAAPSSSSGSNKKQNQAKTKQQPENQHGKNLGPTKRKSSRHSEISRLEQIIGHLDDYEPDMTKIKLTNWLYSLDNENLDGDNCIRISKTLDSFVDDAYSSIEEDISPATASDALAEKIFTKLNL